MNLKKVFPLFLLLTLFIRANAKPIDPKTAEKTATAFFKTVPVRPSMKKSDGASPLRLAYTCTDKSKASPRYYVYNRGENEGFVIVSADDRAKSVLGYSAEGRFCPDNLPGNFRYWLGLYQEELNNLPDETEDTDERHNRKHLPAGAKSHETPVAPLLGNIQYGQDAPFNNLCPLIPGSMTRTVTGCVATSMAQVMRFHQWPKQGKSSHSYTTRDLKIPLSADFANTIYDWENMPESYLDSNSGETQKNAVATLMLHCGIAVGMNYNTSSGASVNEVGTALIRYFGYDASMQFYSRPYFSATEWSDILKTELDNHRPVIYNGVSSSAGHSFVCDGYDAAGLFHINWGWDGMSNGYFELSALNPSEQGTGGGLGGYNRDQSIITGIKPSDGTPKESRYQIRLVKGVSYDSQEVTTGGKAVISFGYRNLGIGSFYGYHGLALYTPGGTLVKVLSRGMLGHKENDELIPDTLTTGSGNERLKSNITAGNDLPQGTFRIYPVFQFGTAIDDNKWEIIPGEVGMPCYLNAEISDSGIRFGYPVENMPAFTLTGLATAGNLYQDRTGRFEFTLGNTGTEYTGEIYIRITDKNENSISQVIGPEGISVPAGETKHYKLTGPVSLPPGAYLATLYYNYKNGFLDSVGDDLSVNILETPAEAPDITLTKLETDLNLARIDKREEIVFKATLRNDGGYGEARAMANIYFTDGSYGESFGNQYVYLEKGEEKEYLFSGTTKMESGAYYSRIYLQVTDKEWESAKPLSVNKLSFTLVDTGSRAESQTGSQPVVYPSPATDILYIDGIQPGGVIRIFDLSGQVIRTQTSGGTRVAFIDVSNLKSGTYILQISTETDVINRKFTKK